MSDPDEALAERLARLAERRQRSAPVRNVAGARDAHTDVPVLPSGRRHPAAAAKIVTTGLATSGFLGTIGMLAAHGAAPAQSSTPAQVQPATPSTVIVVDTVHRTVYVDEFGNPIEPSAPAVGTVPTAATETVATSDPGGAYDVARPMHGDPVQTSTTAPLATVVPVPGSPPPMDPGVTAAPVGANTPTTAARPAQGSGSTTPPVTAAPTGPVVTAAPDPGLPPTSAAAPPPGPDAAPATTQPAEQPPASTAPASTAPPPTAPPPTAPAETAPPATVAASAAADDGCAGCDDGAPAPVVPGHTMSVALSLPRTRTWLRASAALMGTAAEVLVDGTAEQLAAGFRRLRALEASWSRFQPDSELNRLHRRGGQWTPVSDDLLRALTWAQRMTAETGGLFDPSIRAALETLGYDRTYMEGLDAEVAAAEVGAAPGIAGLEVDRLNRRARIVPGLSIDLGGIGKGLAADIVATELVADGARAAFVSLGGDVHACGEPAEDGSWPVPLIHPVTGARIAVHPLASGGLVMSTTQLRTWRRGGRTLHHIIDPRTGRSTSTDLVAVAVASASAARAEALAKAAIVVGAADGFDLLTAAGVDAWLVMARTVVTIEAAL